MHTTLGIPLVSEAANKTLVELT